jgi:hypothetical protein
MMSFRALAALGLVAAPLAGAAAQESAGVAALVRNQVTGEIGSSQRTVVRGDKLFRNEKVATGPASQLNVLFLDETSLSLGPNTTIVLDEMVFDPNSGQGKVVLSIPVGVTRFVSGVLPKTDYEIRTPSMSVGIRGTTVDFFVRPNGDTTAVLRSGELFASNLGQPGLPPTVVSTPGLSVTGNRNAPLGPPGPVPPDAAQAFSQLPGSQVGLAATPVSPYGAATGVAGSPVSARTYRDSLSTIGNTGITGNTAPVKICTSNGTHSQGSAGC